MKKLAKSISGYEINEKYLKNEGFIFNIQKFSIHDGSGIRTIIFFKGCPLGCIWCSNPESQHYYPEIFYFEEKCIFCKRCEAICPQGKVKKSKEKSIYNKVCIKNCSKPCIHSCLVEAMVLTGEKISVNSIVKSVMQDKDFYFISNGGVTLSGGEPFFQPSFLFSLIKILKYLSINIAVETCGYFNYKENLESIELIDLFLYDLKVINLDKHIDYTNKENSLILKNLIKLIDGNKKVLVRIPIISSLNDTEKDLIEFLNFIKPINKKLQGINLLPYHKLGSSKYKRLGKQYSLEINAPKQQDLQEIKSFFENNGITNVNIID